MKCKIHLLFFVMLFHLICCSGNDAEPPDEEQTEEPQIETPDPDKAIPDIESAVQDLVAQNKLVGVWTIIYNGLGEVSDAYTESLGTIEFMEDGTIRKYSKYPDEYSDKYTSTLIYKISSMYYYSKVITNDVNNIGIENVYTYKFYDDKFRIDIISGIITYDDIYIYKRLEK